MSRCAWPFGIGLFLPLALQLFPDGRLRRPAAGGGRSSAHRGVRAGVRRRDGRRPGRWSGGPHASSRRSCCPATTGSARCGRSRTSLPLVGLAVAIAGLVVRYRRGDERLRRQLLWLVLALDRRRSGSTCPRWVVGDGADPAAARHRRWCRSRSPWRSCATSCSTSGWCVSRTVLYLLLTLGVVGAYAGLVAVLDALLRGAGAPGARDAADRVGVQSGPGAAAARRRPAVLRARGRPGQRGVAGRRAARGRRRPRPACWTRPRGAAAAVRRAALRRAARSPPSGTPPADAARGRR